MGIFDLFGVSKEWLTSKDVEVGKDYKYVAEYADRRRKGVTSCRTLKRKVKSKGKGAKRHDFDMRFDMGGDKRALFFVRTEKPIFKSCKRRKGWLLFAFAFSVAFAFSGVSLSARLENRVFCEVIKLAAPFFPVVKC